MAIHNFGPIHHSESPTSMNMTGWVDDDGNYSITFATNFANGESYNYPWTIYIGTDSSNPVMEILKDEEAQLCLTDSDGNFLLDANGNYLVITS